VLLPGAVMILLLLCNDSEILGPWVNAPFANVLAVIIFGVLLVLSVILTLATLIPRIDVSLLVLALGAGLAATLTLIALRNRSRGGGRRASFLGDRGAWRMPPEALFNRATWSRTRFLGMCALRAYSVVAVTALLVKTVELGTGH
jgi:hypothetical protein